MVCSNEVRRQIDSTGNPVKRRSDLVLYSESTIELAGRFAIVAQWFDARWFDIAQLTGWGIVACILVVASTASWLTNLIALPGNWISVLLTLFYCWMGPRSGRLSIDLSTVLVIFGLAVFGELIEFVSGALGAKKAGASKKSTLYSILGSMGGAMVGAVVGVPIPVVGSIVAALLFGGVGAAAGAMYGEFNDGRQWKENWMIGHATFWGRTFGTLGKFLVGSVIVSIILLAVSI